MRIAQIAPLLVRVPPIGYGGIELVVSPLTDELVRRGHEVTLFATGDSETLAKLESVYPQGLYGDSTVTDRNAYLTLQLHKVYERADEFDIIHSHVEYPGFSFASFAKTPTVHTIHNGFTKENKLLYQQCKHLNYISISNTQREGLPELNYVGTVYNGIKIDDYEFHPQPNEEPYLAFLGRADPDKGPQLAIEMAKRTGWKLKMACRVNSLEQEFFDTEIMPHVDGEQIQLAGEISPEEKSKLMGGAVATLFPITWREPFGLVMTESMVTGTPVIAMALGAAPEVIVDGKTGFLCNNIDELVAAVGRVSELDRSVTRQHVLDNFGVSSMVDGYEKVYQQILEKSSS